MAGPGVECVAGGEVRLELTRILASPQFSTARRLSAFLEYVVTASLDGQQVKESLIGVSVYGRDPSYNPKDDSIVRAEASRLRAKLREYYAEAGAADTVIIELPKGSYTPVFQRRPPAIEPEAPRPLRRRWAMPAGLLLVVGLAAGMFYWVRPRTHAIAIMPIQIVGGDHTRDSLADTLTAQLTRSLMASKGWRVVGQAPHVDFTVRDQELAALRHTGAEVVLAGSLQSIGGTQARLTLELINATDGYLAWREVYDRPVMQVAESQQELAAAIVEALTTRYTGRPASVQDPWYRAARERWSTYTVAGLQESLGLFQKSIEADRRSARSWAGYADANCRLSDDSPMVDTRGYVEAARKAAVQAIALDGSNAEAHGVLGRIYLYKDWNFPAAVRELQQAVALDPARLWPSISYSQALSITGDMANAQAVIQAARARLSPVPELVLQEGSVFFLARKYERMEAIGRELIGLAPDRAEGHWLVGLSLEQRGRVREGIEEYQRGLQAAARDDLRTLCALSHAYGLVGDEKRARETMARFMPPTPKMDRFALCYCAALTEVGLKRRDEAFRWLEKAREIKDSSLPFLTGDPRFDVLRGDARYTKLAAGLGR